MSKRRRRGGRPRNPTADRKPSGRPRDRDHGPTPEALAQRAAMLPGVTDPHLLLTAAAGTPMGRLRLAGLITDLQLRAGERWWGTVRAYHRLLTSGLEGPKPPSAVDLNREMGRTNRFPGEIFARLKGEYDLSYELLLARGRLVLIAVNDAIWDREPHLERLREGLDALAAAERAIVKAGMDAADRYREIEERAETQDVDATRKSA